MDRGLGRGPGGSWIVPGLIVAALGVAVGLASGCGNLTAGGVAEATVAVSGDAPDAGAPAASKAPVFLAAILPVIGGDGAVFGRARRAVLGAASRLDDEPEGEVEVEFKIFLVTSDGDVVSLGDRAVRVRVDIPGRTEVRPVRRRTIPAESYSRVRVVFTEIEAEVEAGLIIDGEPLLGPVEVELEADSLPVEAAVEFQVPQGGEVELLVDLNSSAWLRAADPALQIVAQRIFENALEVRVR